MTFTERMWTSTWKQMRKRSNRKRFSVEINFCSQKITMEKFTNIRHRNNYNDIAGENFDGDM